MDYIHIALCIFLKITNYATYNYVYSFQLSVHVQYTCTCIIWVHAEYLQVMYVPLSRSVPTEAGPSSLNFWLNF